MSGVLQAVVLAAGMGTRLGRPLPKPLTRLRDGRSILKQQVENLRSEFGQHLPITIVVGFKATLVMEAAPKLLFAYNPHYDSTNTAKSLLRALRTSQPGGVLWLNGDVVFDPRLLQVLRPHLDADESVVSVNTSAVADEEIKYTVDDEGYVQLLSKSVVGGLGEAVGINYVSSTDKPVLMDHLRKCSRTDYFERAIETATAAGGLRFRPVDISAYSAVEVDFEEDLLRADVLTFAEED